jgi:hypothetical protein
MRYLDRRFLFPVAGVTAWAQQPSPAAAEAEAALRVRVEQYYQLQVDKKFRQAEGMVAEDSKDDYYNRAKQDIRGFSIQQIELLDSNNRARVTIKGKISLKAALLGAQEFDLPLLSNWKLENGQWVWYVDRETRGQTPFGRITPPAGDTAKGAPVPPPRTGIDVKTLMSQVTVDSTTVTLNASHPEQAVTFTNHLPGSITLELTKPQMADILIELDKSALTAGETSAIRFRLTGHAKTSGVLRVVASPLNEVFEIQIHSN